MAQTVLVLFGGVSTEYAISLRSAYNIIGGLRAAGYRVVRVGITPQGDWLRFDGPDEAIAADTWQNLAQAAADQAAVLPIRSPRDFIVALCGCVPDCVFPAVHGINCEDGALQGLLRLSGLPTVGCGVLASAACMDKLHARQVFRAAHIPQCKATSATREQIRRNAASVAERAARKVGYPCFLKPSNGGSSVGTCRADNLEELVAALGQASQYDRVVLIEAFVQAREIEVSILGNDNPRIGAVGEVATTAAVAYYDYEAKYLRDDGAAIHVPAELDETTAARVRRYALKAYKAMGCTGMARVDFFIERGTGAVLLNEINTIPGFTPISIFPKAFAAAGLTLPALVRRLCQLAIREHQALSRREQL
jgi:D-alanine-D-alanine ligase